LTGLHSMVPYYSEAIDAILDIELEGYTEEELGLISHSAELLYTLIHQRFVQSRAGIQQLYEKFCAGEFGTCPRFLCEEQCLVPVGLSNRPGVATVKLFCARCLDIYEPLKQQAVLDGCAFGTTAAHLMFQSVERAAELVRNRSRFGKNVYIPTVFGFRIHPSSACGSQMLWLRRDNDGQPLVPPPASLNTSSTHSSQRSLEISQMSEDD